jgi:hypothetical protein
MSVGLAFCNRDRDHRSSEGWEGGEGAYNGVQQDDKVLGLCPGLATIMVDVSVIGQFVLAVLCQMLVNGSFG